ncbi:hypothetical protein EX30DRAFT_345297 [Ascodesmis nigricans]|uniref:Uncharacterized protein n=1 Tax=Ascodesmis nigricans TaxID=341454 RepID=A0A4S2N5M9_9PEZI|nr:hypothetical protein EX30DRAFT_345297 [Ascodesmis nigricans]
MQFRTARCLACDNADTHYPRLNYNHTELPYCSNCASTTSLIPDPLYSVPSPPSKDVSPSFNNDFTDLAAMFSKNMVLSQQQMQYEHQQYLLQNSQQVPHEMLPTPPMSPTANYSISQHYHHSTYTHSPPQVPTQPQQTAFNVDDMMDDDPVSSQLFGEMAAYSTQQQQRQQQEYDLLQQQLQQQQVEAEAAERQRLEREYAAYLYSADLSSPSSNDALAIEEAVEQRVQRNQALDENCSASEMLLAAAKEREVKKAEDERMENERKIGRAEAPAFRNSEWFNDYYGGLDSMYETYADADEDAPCCIVGMGGVRLKPFDY